MANGVDNCCLLFKNHKLPRMNRTARCETKCREAVCKLIITLHAKRYRLINLQNSYTPSGKQHTGRCEAQSRELVK
jgi:hypothetical protein